MSDIENNSKEYVIKVELPQVVNATLIPLASAIGEILSHGWRGMTMGIETWYGKKEIDRNLNLQLYKETLERNLSNINEDNLQEPQMNIVGPALDASKYYFEEEQYREMFSKLIASSCDRRKNPYTHPAFVEFIKQMTSLEGKILKDIDLSQLFLINIIDVSDKNHKNIGLIPPVINLYNASIFELNTSLTNLSRLGLIEFPNITSLIYVDEKVEQIQTSSLYNSIIESLKDELSFEYKAVIYPLEVTSLGKSFIKVCIE